MIAHHVARIGNILNDSDLLSRMSDSDVAALQRLKVTLSDPSYRHDVDDSISVTIKRILIKYS